MKNCFPNADFDSEGMKTMRVRLDASERMCSAFAGKAHTDWVQEKVAASLADSRSNLSHGQVMADA